MIASLPMYDWPVLRALNDRFWAELRGQLAARGVDDAPATLARADSFRASWLKPDLLFAQTCGLPFNTELTDKVRYLATPVYATEGCDGATYRSAMVVRRGRGVTCWNRRRLVINGPDSWSGWVAITRYCLSRNQAVPQPAMVSGGHLASMQAVAAGKADVAAIDAVCWGLAGRYMPELTDGLEVVEWTDPAPATPFITGLRTSDRTLAILQDALTAATATPAGEALLLEGIDVLADGAYREMSQPFMPV